VSGTNVSREERGKRWGREWEERGKRWGRRYGEKG